jgi:NADPH:quinone reductase-like Zn-dependent oxidoreductase
MRAVRLHRFGGPECLVLEEVPPPEPGPRDILLRVAASGVNPIEWKIRGGAMARALGRELPVTFGWAAAGMVERVGAAVARFRPGDRVFAYPEFARGGTHAELVAVAEEQAAPMPDGLGFVEAAAIPMTAQAAWTALEAAAPVPGQRVLVHGAAGAVGHWLVQLAAARGLDVAATASGDAALGAVRANGAAEALDHRARRFEELGRFDTVFDLVGGETQDRSWAVLRPGGTLVSTVAPPPPGPAAQLGLRAAFVFTPPDGAVLERIGALIASGRLRPLPPARVMPLAAAAEAHALAERGHAGGKIVLTP